GDVVPLEEQDRSRWDRAQIEEGAALLEGVLRDGALGAYALQAAIAAVHARAGRAEDTAWGEIAALYSMLAQVRPSPVLELNRATTGRPAEHGGGLSPARLSIRPAPVRLYYERRTARRNIRGIHALVHGAKRRAERRAGRARRDEEVRGRARAPREATTRRAA